MCCSYPCRWHSLVSLLHSQCITLVFLLHFLPRVLFSAHPPYTVVHTNAAYVSLVQQRSTTNPCLVGGAFTGNTTMQQIDGESSETCVARMVMEHMQELDADVSDDEASNLRRTRNPSLRHQPRPGLFYYIFPVLSVNDPYSQFLRGYTHDFERRQGIDKQKTETSMTISNSDVTATTASSSITSSTSILDLSSAVEPQGSSSNNSGSRSTSPIQFRTQYLLQIEPDNRYPY